MPTQSEAAAFAREWIDAWNSHDLNRILSHYACDVVLTSPVAAQVTGDPSGKVIGTDALRQYFQRGLEAYPNLQFTLLDVMRGLTSVVLYYKNQNGTKTGEFIELGICLTQVHTSGSVLACGRLSAGFA